MGEEEAKLAVAVADLVEEKIAVAICDDWYFFLTTNIGGSGRVFFSLEVEDYNGPDESQHFKFNTGDDRYYRIVKAVMDRETWLAYPWPVRAFIESYNFAVEKALSSLGWIDNLIKNEREAI